MIHSGNQTKRRVSARGRTTAKLSSNAKLANSVFRYTPLLSATSTAKIAHAGTCTYCIWFEAAAV